VKSKLSMTGTFDNYGQLVPDYGGKIYIADWGTDGSSYPSGTAEQPVATCSAAYALAQRYNIHEFWITGEHTLAHDPSSMTFVGWGPLDFNKIDLNGRTLSKVRFINCSLTGVMVATTVPGSGWQTNVASVTMEDCYLFEVEDLEGRLVRCTIDGTTLVKAGGWVDAAHTIIQGDNTFFDLRDTANTTVSMDIESGWAQFLNCVDCLIELNVKGGEVSFDASCVSGFYYMEGVGTLFNDGTLTKKENHFLWDEPRSYHKEADSTGRMLDELNQLQGLDLAHPMTVSATARTVDTIELDIATGGGGDVTVTRQP